MSERFRATWVEIDLEAVPANVAAHASAAANTITLTWSASVDPQSSVDHYIVYHNPDRLGLLKKLDQGYEVVTSKDVKRLPGNRIWEITAENRPRRYFLCATFLVDEVGTRS